jgi:hypothetical protein
MLVLPGKPKTILTKKIIITGLTLAAVILIAMGLYNFLKKTPASPQQSPGPYKDPATNLIYNMLFGDNPDLFKANSKPPHHYPFDILFAETSSADDLQKIIDDSSSDPRIKILAYNKQLANGYKLGKKELLAVIVEVGLDNGLDVLASFNNGTARYISQTGKMIAWETATDEKANELTKALFTNSQAIVNQIGPWDKPRKVHPAKGIARISFLVSDGLYFGEGPMNVLFNDPMASAALNSATQLMQYLTERSLRVEK